MKWLLSCFHGCRGMLLVSRDIVKLSWVFNPTDTRKYMYHLLFAHTISTLPNTISTLLNTISTLPNTTDI